MTRTTTLTLALAVCLAAPAALAADAARTIKTAAVPEATWEAVGDFCAIAAWHPAVTKCELSDNGGTPRRTLTLDGGGTIVEDLVGRDDDAMSYTYRIIESPLPVAGYESTIKVSAEGEGSRVDWNGSFEPSGASEDEALTVIEGIYDAGLDGIKTTAEQ
ncbi:SRPBCC family protein [Acuticoccus sp. I52.16.1]|uniref:SRPBCC family protein n=1 Tax=Acuticoccus sp. I52.16.1 TaxID=2928472 RepID=UPI001FD4FFE8|nr:SRPBCC family protein [Acuticoccus sp. I52.16.1]UOM34271.1 SRPBCC family protein [Acuticoccus sp. I52.16.1]